MNHNVFEINDGLGSVIIRPDLMALLGVSDSTIKRWIKKGYIDSVDGKIYQKHLMDFRTELVRAS